MRAIAAILAGLIAGFVVIILIGVIGLRATYAVPAGLDPYDGRQVLALLKAMPAAPKLALLAALFGGTLAGAALAKLVARRAWAGWTVAGLIALYFAFSMLSLPLAGLEQALAIAGPIVGGLIGVHLVKARPAAIDEDAAATGDA
ncbi:MAG TPA: hypothetical protein VLK25_09990 [Allosphingosinicella sp.]|nr:hypothetical protein [Allosphingosinicella sp.]